MADRIEIRDGKEFRVTVLPQGRTGKPRCFKCKRQKNPDQMAASGKRKNGTTWHLCKRCGEKWSTRE